MSKKSLAPEIAAATPEIDDRLWQAWVAKNSELDRRDRAKRFWFMITLAVAGAGAAVLIYLQ